MSAENNMSIENNISIEENKINVIEKAKRIKKIDPVCQICDEKLNKSSHILIECLYCKFEACRKCCETYTTNEPIVKCMNPQCGREWTRKFIRDVFTLVFINGPLKQHREQLLFDQERALLPATQPIIESKIACAKIDVEAQEIERQIRILRRKLIELIRKKDSLKINPTQNTERIRFVRGCPDEDCRGFLSSQWKCGICEKWTCPDCHVIKGFTRDAEHTCNPDDVATATLLANDTKSCPKCSTSIFKIDGCDQMWCTQCHTAFSWRTGTIQNNIHNPHYYEWLRRTNNGEAPRNRDDIPCGRELNHHLSESITRCLRLYHEKASNYRDCVSKCTHIIRYTIHLIHNEQPTLENYQRRNENLRVQYLMKEITEEFMKDQLQRDNKRYNKNREIADIYQIVSNTVTDIMYRFLDYLKNDASRVYSTNNLLNTDILLEINTIVDYANECLYDVSRTYSCSRIVLSKTIQLFKGVNASRYLMQQQSN